MRRLVKQTTDLIWSHFNVENLWKMWIAQICHSTDFASICLRIFSNFYIRPSDFQCQTNLSVNRLQGIWYQYFSFFTSDPYFKSYRQTFNVFSRSNKMSVHTMTVASDVDIFFLSFLHLTIRLSMSDKLVSWQTSGIWDQYFLFFTSDHQIFNIFSRSNKMSVHISTVASDFDIIFISFLHLTIRLSMTDKLVLRQTLGIWYHYFFLFMSDIFSRSNKFVAWQST